MFKQVTSSSLGILLAAIIMAGCGSGGDGGGKPSEPDLPDVEPEPEICAANTNTEVYTPPSDFDCGSEGASLLCGRYYQFRIDTTCGTVQFREAVFDGQGQAAFSDTVDGNGAPSTTGSTAAYTYDTPNQQATLGNDGQAVYNPNGSVVAVAETNSDAEAFSFLLKQTTAEERNTASLAANMHCAMLGAPKTEGGSQSASGLLPLHLAFATNSETGKLDVTIATNWISLFLNLPEPINSLIAIFSESYPLTFSTPLYHFGSNGFFTIGNQTGNATALAGAFNPDNKIAVFRMNLANLFIKYKDYLTVYDQSVVCIEKVDGITTFADDYLAISNTNTLDVPTKPVDASNDVGVFSVTESANILSLTPLLPTSSGSTAESDIGYEINDQGMVQDLDEVRLGYLGKDSDLALLWSKVAAKDATAEVPATNGAPAIPASPAVPASNSIRLLIKRNNDE